VDLMRKTDYGKNGYYTHPVNVCPKFWVREMGGDVGGTATA